MSPVQRHAARIEIDPETGCWNWTGSDRSAPGYSRFFVNGKRMLVHRWAYEQFVGPIPEGATVHHRCTNPRCSNPAHLQAMTQRRNILESDSALASINARRTHCVNGHDLAEAYVNPRSGRRTCRPCRNERMRRKRAGRAGISPAR